MPTARARALWLAPSPGLVPPTAGRVSSSTGRRSRDSRRTASASSGLTYIPEGRGIFPGLTVVDNLRMAVGQEKRHERAAAIDRAIERFPVLGQRRTQRAGSLSGGEQQMLALARALAVSPKLVIADEMSLGLAPIVTESVFEALEEAPPFGHHDRAHRAVRPSRLGHGGCLRRPHAAGRSAGPAPPRRRAKRSSTAISATPSGRRPRLCRQAR